MSKNTISPGDSAAVAAEWSVDTEPPQLPAGPPALSVRTQVWAALIILLLVNLFFLAANVAHSLGDGSEDGVLGIFAPIAWEGDHDGSHIEVWGHIQLFAAAGILVVLSVVHRMFLFGAWALLLFVVVIDDLFQVHEEAGEWLVQALGLQPALGLRAEDFGELITWGILGLIVLLPLAVGHVRANKWARRQSWTFVGILALLAVFAIGLDMVAIILQGHVPGQVLRLVSLSETAGEIIPMSLFLAFTITLAVMPQHRLLGQKDG